ncbi:MAG: fructosamine kinase family protein [Rothia sp. (in: high G+C Gram-positive bacteria)]|nr:fructosamine kinase family protein [Rothia sp. (in: high G+C Gram-positive bacteria)]
MEIFSKHGSAQAVAWEAAGLRWLGEATEDGGARVAQVLGAQGERLTIEHVQESTPTKSVARDFGARLAQTHLAGADAFGAGPTGWEGNGLQGPARNQLELPLNHHSSWGAMWAQERIAPLVRKVQDFGAHERGVFGELCALLREGKFDGSYSEGSTPARVHGDLWAGNVLWTEDEAVLIDPTPYGGHPEDDLAALALFGAPHLKEIIAGYQQVTPLDEGWEDRVELHQLHLLLLHAVLFGGNYGRQALKAARRYL